MDLKNSLYRKVVTPCGASLDGETATIVTLTEETNCFILWMEGSDYSVCPLRVFPIRQRDEAIEGAVYLGGLSERQLAEGVLIPARCHDRPDLRMAKAIDIVDVSRGGGVMDLKNSLYRNVIAPCGASLDGETATIVTLTEETNCFIMWMEGSDYSVCPLRVFPITQRDEAIEKAVHLGGLSERQLVEEVLVPPPRHDRPDLRMAKAIDIVDVGV